MKILRFLSILISAIIFPYYFTTVRQELYQNQQYRHDLLAFGNKNEHSANKMTGIRYHNRKLLLVTSILMIIFIILQYGITLYNIKYKYQYPDKIRIVDPEADQGP